MTLPEILLWQQLRLRPCGFKFRKQFPLGPYSADFACVAARLIIEVDGIAHDMGDNPERDEARDRYFTDRGYRVLRLAAKVILQEIDVAVNTIVVQCKEVPSLLTETRFEAHP